MSYKNFVHVRPGSTIFDYDKYRGEWMILRIEKSNFSVGEALRWASQSQEGWFEIDSDPGVRRVAVLFSLRDSDLSPEEVSRLIEGCNNTETIHWNYGEMTFHSAVREFANHAAGKCKNCSES